MRLEVAPARVGRAAEAGTVRQPLDAVDRRLVLLFRCADLDLDLHLVALVRTHDRGERIAGPPIAVDEVSVLRIGAITIALRQIQL